MLPANIDQFSSSNYIKAMTIILQRPDNMPRRNGRFSVWFGEKMLKMMGWKVVGEIPDLKKCMIAAAPHTSNWDFVMAMCALMALDVKAYWMMKKEAFFWPVKGLFMSLGGMPTDRSAAGGVVGQIAKEFANRDSLWVGITPEGTRSKVERWKTGFLRIAHEAQVPVVLVGWDFPNKQMKFGKVFHPTGDHEKDIAEIYQFFAENYTGKNPELF